MHYTMSCAIVLSRCTKLNKRRQLHWCGPCGRQQHFFTSRPPGRTQVCLWSDYASLHDIQGVKETCVVVKLVQVIYHYKPFSIQCTQIIGDK